MSEKRRGLGRGLGALIPSNSTPPTRPSGERPVDLFFPGRGEAGDQIEVDGQAEAPGGVQARGVGVPVLPGARTPESTTFPGGSTQAPAIFAPSARLAPSAPESPGSL
ncbi:MAG TPA: hypothetical protein VHN80_26525, partial [Kineosporiaceae bacterium]|nr:hypothetical protein [Kineosporiaceae bacterium]